jgi:cytochrome c oxidase assembly factor CtaG
MSGGVRRLRSGALVGALVLWVVFLVPPLGGMAERYEFVNALQYGVFAFWAPTLLVVGAPWTWLSRRGAAGTGEATWLSRWRSHRESPGRESRAIRWVSIFIALEIFWRVVPVVDHLSVHPAGAVLEAVSFAISGVALFLSLVESPPLSAGTKRVYRTGLAAVAMWTIWIIGYMDGMSNAGWYHVFHHVAGSGISLVADKQFSTGILWFTSAVTFIPIVFWNMVHWLQSEATPDEEMYDLVHEDRTRGFFGTG